MVNKAPKVLKPKLDKEVKQARKKAAANPFEAFLQPSEKLLKLRDEAGGKDLPEPFLELFVLVLVLLSFFVWKLNNATQTGHVASQGVWYLFLYGTIAVLNFWSLLLVMVMAKRNGDIGLMRISDREVLRFLGLTGIFGTWAGILRKLFFFIQDRSIRQGISAVLFWKTDPLFFFVCVFLSLQSTDTSRKIASSHPKLLLPPSSTFCGSPSTSHTLYSRAPIPTYLTDHLLHLFPIFNRR